MPGPVIRSRLERPGIPSHLPFPVFRFRTLWMRGARPFLPAVLLGLLGLFFAIAAWFTVAAWEDHEAQQSFEKSAADHVQALQTGLDEYLHAISALRGLFDSSETGVSRRAFSIFAQTLPDERKAVLAFSWLPKVSGEARDAYERAAVRDGIPGYRIKHVGTGGRMHVAPPKPVYFPVYYLSTGPHTRSFGIDLHDGGIRQEALDRARDGDIMAASGNIMLQSGDGNRSGFFVVLPVYRPHQPHGTLAERRRNLIGYVHGVFQFHVLADAIMSDMQSPLHFALFETVADAEGNASMVQFDDAGGPAAPGSSAEGPEWIGHISTGDRQWRVVVTPSVRDSWLLRHDRAWIIGLAILLVSALIFAYLCNLIRQRQKLHAAGETASLLARTDALTGLANRRAFAEQLETAFAAVAAGGAPFAVHLLDLDEFKDINDTQGHATGDALLKAVAARLLRTVGPMDLVARFGGDEFAILQHHVGDVPGASMLAEAILAAAAAPHDIDGTDLHIDASIGIALHSDRIDGAKGILMQADLALYRAKDDGRGCFRFHRGELDRIVHARVNLTEELRAGIARGELELHYQVQVDIPSGRIIGLEALVRWNHPIRGEIQPSVFIPIAERMGAIAPLGEWVLARACRQSWEWERAGIAVPPIAVNVSAVQLRQPMGFERCVAENFMRYGIRPGAIELELTESVLMEVTERQNNALTGLQQLGATIAIDDFGTGYSSLKYLTTYPVQRLKIAQELVAGITSDSRSAVVVRSTIRLAQDLGIACIAEGIEREEQALFLADLGCEQAQGYFYGRPMPATRIARLLPRAGAPAMPLRIVGER